MRALIKQEAAPGLTRQAAHTELDLATSRSRLRNRDLYRHIFNGDAWAAAIIPIP